MPTGHYDRPSLIRRFWAKVDRKNDNDCWLWIGAVTPKGYGKIINNGKTIYTHRLSLEIHLGRPIKDGFLACHINDCNNPSCCNPYHLYEGTYSNNNKDRVDIGHGVGEDSVSRLTAKEVHKIRADRRLYAEIAKSYNVSTGTVFNIKNLRVWTHLPVIGEIYIDTNRKKYITCPTCGYDVDAGNYTSHNAKCDGRGPRRRKDRVVHTDDELERVQVLLVEELKHETL
ncbi:MAG: hypothetical protein IT564_11455 [Rhodospirillales bacterium]|nr:hypothetical protein [Rhodospirillales bacterium]